MGLQIFQESRVMGVSFGGPNWWSELAVRTGSDWSELVDVNWLPDCLMFQSSLCTCLSRIKVEHLGSITFSNILKLVSEKSSPLFGIYFPGCV